MGVVVPKHRRTIVQRNRLKRRLRELVRGLVLPGLDARGLALDVVVRARGEAYAASYVSLSAELASWLERRCSRAP